MSRSLIPRSWTIDDVEMLVPRPPRRSLPAMPPAGMPSPPSPPFPAPCGPLPIGVPVGTVVAFAGEIRGQGAKSQASTATEPQGWMVCDGRKLHRAMYPELFAAIGFRYLTAQESPGAYYRVPDLQGYFLRGVDPVGTVDPDTKKRMTPAGSQATSPLVGSTQKSAFQAHEHEYTKPMPAGTTPGQGSPVNMIQTEEGDTTAVVGEKGAADPLTSEQETRPVNVAVYYLIKFTNGGFPWTAPLGGAFWER